MSEGGSYRVIWVRQDGSIFKSAWSSDRKEETDRYYALQDDENVKRVALYEKQKLNQWDRSVGPDTDRSARGAE
jgi:hypothetical protein